MLKAFTILLIVKIACTDLNNNLKEVEIFVSSLQNVLYFMDKHYNEFNLDGLVGFTIAEGQIQCILENGVNISFDLRQRLKRIKAEFEKYRKKIQPLLPTTPSKMLLFQKYLLDPDVWSRNNKFSKNVLDDLGIYKNWTAETILSNKHAVYRGVPTDVCIEEILNPENEFCDISSLCETMMLTKRIDTGYLLSHRLFYLQVADIKKCQINKTIRRMYSKYFCSLMLKEARTSEYLGYPYYDIFIEQNCEYLHQKDNDEAIYLNVVKGFCSGFTFCGMEGYEEYHKPSWRNFLIERQTKKGCYRNREINIALRSSNIISHGCSDHTTGLGAASLALNIKYLLINQETRNIT